MISWNLHLSWPPEHDLRICANFTWYYNLTSLACWGESDRINRPNFFGIGDVAFVYQTNKRLMENNILRLTASIISWNDFDPVQINYGIFIRLKIKEVKLSRCEQF